MRWGVLGLLAVTGLGACGGPTLELPRASDGEVRVELLPAGAPGTVAPVFRARLTNFAAPGALWLFRGSVTDSQARALKKGEPAASLEARAVGLRYWSDSHDSVAQPLEWLVPGEDYTLAASGFGVIRTLTVREAGPAVKLVFPPPGRPKRGISVLCDVPPDVASELPLSPSGEATVEPGVLGQPFDGCVTLTPSAPPREPLVGPPVAWGVLLEPSAWLPALEPPQVEGVCAAGKPFHGACLEVEDDRIWVSGANDDALFVLSQPEPRLVPVRLGARAVLLRGLSPGSHLGFVGSVLLARGGVESFDAEVDTAGPRRHVVLNEVLANAVGPEPSAEWIEVVNDAENPASLGGLWLEDSAAHVPLPDAVLEPGELALLVPAGFRESTSDVPIPDGVRRLEVASLGARGLSNSGEALLLVGPEGVVSRFPRLAAPHAGRSVARLSPSSADDDPEAFGEHSAPGASPGRPNQLSD